MEQFLYVQPKIYYASDHDIDPSLIDSDAVYIINKLKAAGFSAYLVGGSVRDLLIKRTPKDYDISTSARPEQIKTIFQRSCLLIGRRFRLAHIRFGHKIMEVSTFRAGDNESDLIVQDNCFGTAEEDVRRRDFTINGLFYDPSEHCIIDYVGGWHDLHHKTLRTIGEPHIRFKQDPVRMLRLLKFHARLPDFSIDTSTLEALHRCHGEIIKSSPARILEELLRMLESTAAEQFFRTITATGLLELLFPCLSFFLKGAHAEDIYGYLAITDHLHGEGDIKRPLDRAILTSCLLYPIIEREIAIKYTQKDIIPTFHEIYTLTATIIHSILTSSFSNFPKRLSSTIHFILSAQYRLTPLVGKQHHRTKILQNDEFGLALKFLMIRALKDPSLHQDYEWWKHLHRQITRHAKMPRHHGEELTSGESADESFHSAT